MQELVSSIERVEAVLRELLIGIAENSIEPVRESLMNQARKAVEKQPEVAASIEDFASFKANVSRAADACANAVADWIKSMTVADIEESTYGNITLIPEAKVASKLYSPFSKVMAEYLFDAGDGLGVPSRDWGADRDWHFYVNHQTGRTNRPDYARPDITELNREFDILRELKSELKAAQAEATREEQLSRWDEA